MKQKTIGFEVDFLGPSIVSDELAYIKIKPASPSNGIRFIRTDISEIVPCHPSRLCWKKSAKWTSLQQREARVEGVEHLLSALWGLGITNVDIELDSPHIPILDGSALPFVQEIQAAGIVEEREVYVPKFAVRKSYMVWQSMVDFRTGKTVSGVSHIVATPATDMHISYVLKYKGTALEPQIVEGSITEKTFVNSIAPARTFMTPWEIERWAPDGPEPLLSRHFCDMVPIVSDTEVFEERVPSEAGMHKVLDMIGDLAVLGLTSGAFFGVRSGHSLNRAMVRRIAANG